MKYVVRERKLIPFSWRFEREMKQNASLFERDTESLRVFQKRKKMNSQKCLRENWKGLKTDQVCPKHEIFAIETSSEQVARTSCQNTKKKTLKNFLSVFRDWKFHSRESHELSRENLCVPLTTRPSTREQVTWAVKSMKIQFLKNILSLFRD